MDYKEKLEEAKRIYETANADQRYVLESLFPELKESEDERIKKTLIDYFQTYKEQEECGIKTFFGIPTDNILAWLEKQGEQKSAWSEEDAFRTSALTDVVKSGGSIRPELRNEFVDWLKSIKNRVIPQPKSAWNVEDELVVKDVEESVTNYWYGQSQEDLLD